jgi:uncharacterized protein (DUF1800 family)
MAETDLSLTAHLLRRAGFGASRTELEEYASRPYEDLVEYLLHPEDAAAVEEDIIDRYYSGDDLENVYGSQLVWFYRMVNTRRPLEEKMALFYHQLFPIGSAKVSDPHHIIRQLRTLRRVGLGDLRTILLELSRDPAMIFYLDNSENLNATPNENYGRELMELFSMGVGNYTEQDVKEAARAFTGWTFRQPVPVFPHGSHPTEFEYREQDHDDSIKTLLGETGRLNGEDVVDTIVRQPATARFVSRHLYNFFVADEPPVPTWNEVPPRDPDAIETLVDNYFESGGEIRSMLRVLFNSDFFRDARFQRVKSPVELVVGTLKLVGDFQSPIPIRAGFAGIQHDASAMGQMVYEPPSVEGWRTGQDWIEGGTLTERVNFAVDLVGDPSKPGVRDIVSRLSEAGTPLPPDQCVDQCLDLIGPLEVAEGDRDEFARYIGDGTLRFETEAERTDSQSRIISVLQAIVASREYQFA